MGRIVAEVNKMRLDCASQWRYHRAYAHASWYVNCKSMAARAVDVVRKGDQRSCPQCTRTRGTTGWRTSATGV